MTHTGGPERIVIMQMTTDGTVIGQIVVMILAVERITTEGIDTLMDIKIDIMIPGMTVIRRDIGAQNTAMIVVVLMSTVGIPRMIDLEEMTSKLVKTVPEVVPILVKTLNVTARHRIQRRLSPDMTVVLKLL